MKKENKRKQVEAILNLALAFKKKLKDLKEDLPVGFFEKVENLLYQIEVLSNNESQAAVNQTNVEKEMWELAEKLKNKDDSDPVEEIINLKTDEDDFLRKSREEN